tara:strand:+ start:156 stop:599 length:444 start_codon:yes stop_codon:yes gene_type:complete
MKPWFFVVCAVLLSSCIQEEQVYDGPFIAEDGMSRCALPCYDSSISGLVRQFHKNGQLNTEVRYVNGVRHGLFKVYGDDGQLDRSGHFKNGVHHGLFKSYIWGQEYNQWSCHLGVLVRGSYVVINIPPKGSGIFDSGPFPNVCTRMP